MSKLTQVLKTFGRWLVAVWKSVSMAIGSAVLLLTGLLLVIVLAAVSGRSDPQHASYDLRSTVLYQGGKDEIAVIKLAGEITSMSEESFWGFNPLAVSVDNVRAITTKLMALDRVKVVVLVINSPGGSVAASEEIYQLLAYLAEYKPLYVYMGETATSGGYYIALPAKKIVASIPTITGSIGVIAYDPDFSGLFDKLGVNLETYQSGPLKDLGSPARSSTQVERQIFESIVEDSYQLFIDRIVENRQLERATVLELADGRIYSGKQAQAAGLIDEIGTAELTYALAAREEEIDDPTVVEYTLQGGWWTGLFSSSFRKLVPSAGMGEMLLQQRGGVYLL